VAWAAALAPEALGQIQITQLFGGWEMNSKIIETGREVGWLLMVTGWMLVLLIDGLRRRGDF
jgi:hypothetical protein